MAAAEVLNPKADGPMSVVYIKLTDIRPSKTNPRHEEAIDDGFLGDIRGRGVQVPILVRPKAGPTKYEIVYGHRRYYASKKGGLETIPATIRELTDEEALDLQTVENLQRLDLHPLDEAEVLGRIFGRYEKKSGRGGAILATAATVGKDTRYVTERIQLNHLITEAKEPFRKGVFLLGHAIELAKLEPNDQKEALKFLSKDQELSTLQGWTKGQGVSVDTFKAWVRGNIMLDLKKAPFDVADPTLSKQYGACTECPHRTGGNPGLFGDVTDGDFCTVPADFFQKRRITIDRKVEAMAKERGAKMLRVGMGDSYSNNSKSPWHVPVDVYIERGSTTAKLVAAGDECPKTKPGIVVFMSRNIEGKMFAEVNVCVDSTTCSKHKGRSERVMDSGGATRSTVNPDLRDNKRISNLTSSIKAKQRDAIIRAACLKAAEFQKQLPKKVAGIIDVISNEIATMLYGDRHRELAKNVFGIDPAKWREAHKKKDQFGGHNGEEYDRMTESVMGDTGLGWAVAAASMNNYYYEDQEAKTSSWKTLADLLGVDIPKINKEVAASIQERIKEIKAQGERRKAKADREKKAKAKAPAPKTPPIPAVKVAVKGGGKPAPTPTPKGKVKAAKRR